MCSFVLVFVIIGIGVLVMISYDDDNELMNLGKGGLYLLFRFLVAIGVIAAFGLLILRCVSL